MRRGSPIRGRHRRQECQRPKPVVLEKSKHRVGMSVAFPYTRWEFVRHLNSLLSKDLPFLSDGMVCSLNKPMKTLLISLSGFALLATIAVIVLTPDTAPELTADVSAESQEVPGFNKTLPGISAQPTTIQIVETGQSWQVSTLTLKQHPSGEVTGIPAQTGEGKSAAPSYPHDDTHYAKLGEALRVFREEETKDGSEVVVIIRTHDDTELTAFMDLLKAIDDAGIEEVALGEFSKP